jgi:hypothetical protein
LKRKKHSAPCKAINQIANRKPCRVVARSISADRPSRRASLQKAYALEQHNIETATEGGKKRLNMQPIGC